MNEKLQFPFYLNSYKGLSPDQMQNQVIFQNYFPKSQILKKNSKIIPVSDQCTTVQKQTLMKMQQLTLDSLIEDGKINIYPKKNTIDLKNHFSKKLAKIQKKTQKAIMYIAKQLVLKQKNDQK